MLESVLRCVVIKFLFTHFASLVGKKLPSYPILSPRQQHFFLAAQQLFFINIGNDNSQQHEILGSILMGWPGKVFSTKSVKYGKRLWKAYSVVFFCFLPFLFLKVDPKEVKCLLQKISKCIKIKPATLRVIIMIVIIDKRFHTRWRIERGSYF